MSMEIIVPLSQNKYTTISWQDAELDSNSWCLGSGGYAVRHNPAGKAHICLHRVVMSRVLGRALEEYEFVDHIDGDKLNNRRENLRLVTSKQNSRNRRSSKNNTSGYKGVTFLAKRETWLAQIWHQGKNMNLGLYDSPELAARAYNEAALKYHGEHAQLNIIKESKGKN
jgi:hypothetical protein